ncbi:XRE family transcriptional regulator [Actinomycetes bacterium KLBMP 9759]
MLAADLADEAAIEKAPTNAGAWSDASMAWLVGSQKPLGHTDGPSRIGLSDVERLRAMRVVFDGLDGAYGGDHARDSLIQYLRGELPKLLRAEARGEVRRALFVAGAEMTQLAAWMSYDSGRHGLAQRYFIQALGLADAGGDKSLAAAILDAMSHQASFLGRYREAANMARAARLGTQAMDVPLQTAHFFAIEARALARTGDVADCDRAMAGAVEHFERVVDGEGPAWFGYFDASELAAELAHCNRDIGRPDLAIAHASDCLGAAPEEAIRSNFFVAMVLAGAHVDRGDIEEGCRVATEALAAGDALRSARCRTYVDEFKQRLARNRSNPIVRTFAAQVREHHLWTPASGNP